MGKDILVLVPHADDEVLMCGGSIAKHIEQGDTVSVVILQSKRDKHTEDQLNSADSAKSVLNYTNVTFLNIDNVLFSSNFVHVKDSIEKFLMSRCVPDVVYTVLPSDNHQDHQMLFKVASVVFRMHGPCPVKTIYCGETISSTEQASKYFSSFNPTVYNVLADHHINTKIKALLQYSGEVFDFPHPRSSEGIITFAKMRGMECASKYAEAFCCIRDIHT
jgi:LmbE family N-acetylglucosaminyl deacetylase